MNLRKLLLLTWMFTLGQASLLAQAGNPGDALQKAYEAMVAAKKAYENIQHSIDSLRRGGTEREIKTTTVALNCCTQQISARPCNESTPTH